MFNTKQKITLTIDQKTHQFIKEEAKRRNVTIKQVGEEYFYLMITLLKDKDKQKD